MKQPLIPFLLFVLWLGFLQAGEEFDGIPLSQKKALGLPDWIQNRVIYEVNVRQYSDEHSFKAVERDLPRLKELGVGVLWFMPIHPIGEVNRKGTLGSYYSISDYKAVNPEFGTAADFKSFVDAAHAHDIKVILDWVANHTAWDNPLTETNPDFFATDEAGSFVPPYGFDWTDVIQMDYTNRELWDYQAEAMEYWLREFGVDGFRCDYAVGPPTEFWANATAFMLHEYPDMFMLAEAEHPPHQLKGFHAAYGWDMMHTMNDIARGEKDATAIDSSLAKTKVNFPEGSNFLYCTTNHDENSWNGTVLERLGGGAQAFSLVTYALDGIPLIYNGQEAGLEKRLEFFENDPIPWRPHPHFDFFKTLNALRRANPALFTGSQFTRIPTTDNAKVFAVSREAGTDQVVMVANLSAVNNVEVTLASASLNGTYRDVFTREKMDIDHWTTFTFPTWGFKVLEKVR